MQMEALLKESLGTSKLKSYGSGGGGSINRGLGYMTDKGPLFVKINAKREARRMFDGEFASLQALFDTHTIRVPKPIMVLENPSGGSLLVTEYLEMSGKSKFSR
uniref:protein-ribulosamine 3-kinase n=1 Tax=Plectus sambesii TaxID=2011161 RepID=A0A914V9I0_9BILA